MKVLFCHSFPTPFCPTCCCGGAGGRRNIRSWQAMGCGVLQYGWNRAEFCVVCSTLLAEESADTTDLDCTQVNQISSTLQAMIVLVEMYSTKKVPCTQRSLRSLVEMCVIFFLSVFHCRWQRLHCAREVEGEGGTVSRCVQIHPYGHTESLPREYFVALLSTSERDDVDSSLIAPPPPLGCPTLPSLLIAFIPQRECGSL